MYTQHRFIAALLFCSIFLQHCGQLDKQTVDKLPDDTQQRPQPGAPGRAGESEDQAAVSPPQPPFSNSTTRSTHAQRLATQRPGHKVPSRLPNHVSTTSAAVTTPTVVTSLTADTKVIFRQKEERQWQAHVEGRGDPLPVVCKRGQDLNQWIQALASAAPHTHSRHIHILPTNEPRVSRVVYLGSGGLQGGAKKKSRDKGPYPGGCVYPPSTWTTRADGSKVCQSGIHTMPAPRQPRRAQASNRSQPSRRAQASNRPRPPRRAQASNRSRSPYRPVIPPSGPLSLGGTNISVHLAEAINLVTNPPEGDILGAAGDFVYNTLVAPVENYLAVFKDNSDQIAARAEYQVKEIEEKSRELQRHVAATSQKEHQRRQRLKQEEERLDAESNLLSKQLDKALAEQGDEIDKEYCNTSLILEIRDDIKELQKELAEDCPKEGDALPELIHEDIDAILKYIAKEEAELIDFARRTKGLPLDTDKQRRRDYYNRQETKKAKELLEEVKKDINAIIRKRAAALANSQYTSVREAVQALQDTTVSAISNVDLGQLAKEIPNTAALQKRLDSCLHQIKQDSTYTKLNKDFQAACAAYEAKQTTENEASLCKHAQALDSHPLQQELIKLGIRADQLRSAHTDKAVYSSLGPGGVPLGNLLGAEDAAKEAAVAYTCIKRIRQVTRHTSSPRSSDRMGAIARSFADSFVETGAHLKQAGTWVYNSLRQIGNLPQAIKGKVAQLGKDIDTGRRLVEAFLQEVRHEWENPEEYRARLAKVRNLMAVQRSYQRVFNAREYHLGEARNVGQVLGNMAQVELGYKAMQWGLKAIRQGAALLKTVKEARGASSTYSHVLSKISNQIKKRGWTKELIHETVNKPYTTRAATSKLTGNPATAFFHKNGSYVVRDNITGEVIQISNRLNPKWIPDATIIDPYIPK